MNSNRAYHSGGSLTIDEVHLPSPGQPVPPIADKLHRESQEINKHKKSLTPASIERDLYDAEERRDRYLEERVNTAKELEGHGKNMGK